MSQSLGDTRRQSIWLERKARDYLLTGKILRYSDNGTKLSLGFTKGCPLEALVGPGVTVQSGPLLALLQGGNLVPRGGICPLTSNAPELGPGAFKIIIMRVP